MTTTIESTRQTAARMAGYWFFFGVPVGAPVVAILAGQYVVGVMGGPRWAVVVEVLR